MACLVLAVVKTAGLSMPARAHDGSVDLGSVGEAVPRKLRPQFILLQFEICALLGVMDHFFGRLLAPLLLILLLFPLLQFSSRFLSSLELLVGQGVHRFEGQWEDKIEPPCDDSLWLVEKSMREQSISSWSSAWVQFTKYSWKRVHTAQSTFVGKKLSSLVHPL
jgi:hypothetical protein